MLTAYRRRPRIEGPAPSPAVDGAEIDQGPDWGMERARKSLPTLRLLVPGITLDQFKLVGEGNEGIVYRIDQSRCVKFSRRKHREEVASLEQGQGSPFFPKLHYAGRDFMLREYVEGMPLNHYLRRRTLTSDLSAQLIRLFRDLRELGFTRLDMRLSHIIVTPDGRIRIIDPTNLNKDRRSFPRKFFKGMRRRRYADTFIAHLRELDPELLERWSRPLRLPRPAPGGGGPGGDDGGFARTD